MFNSMFCHICKPIKSLYVLWSSIWHYVSNFWPNKLYIYYNKLQIMNYRTNPHKQARQFLLAARRDDSWPSHHRCCHSYLQFPSHLSSTKGRILPLSKSTINMGQMGKILNTQSSYKNNIKNATPIYIVFRVFFKFSILP